jgi:hypothetical protein
MGDMSGRNPVVRDPAITTSLTDEESVLVASKLVYLLYHHYHNDLWGILKPLGICSFSYKGIYMKKKMGEKQTDWQNHALNKFRLPHVNTSIEEWEAAHPGQLFAELSTAERVGIWEAKFLADPEAMSKAMFKPVISVLDTFQIFNSGAREAQSAEDQERMKAVVKMLRVKYNYVCQLAYHFRGLLADRKQDVRVNRYIS